MKFTIENIKSIYPDCVLAGLCVIADDEPFNIFVVDNTDKIVAIYESVWSDDFKTTEYEMLREYDNFGRKMSEVAYEVFEGDCKFRTLN